MPSAACAHIARAFCAFHNIASGDRQANQLASPSGKITRHHHGQGCCSAREMIIIWLSIIAVSHQRRRDTTFYIRDHRLPTAAVDQATKRARHWCAPDAETHSTSISNTKTGSHLLHRTAASICGEIHLLFICAPVWPVFHFKTNLSCRCCSLLWAGKLGGDPHLIACLPNGTLFVWDVM